MATFKIQYAASATPIESTGLTDSNNVVTSVHSSIDKGVSGRNEISCSTTATNVAYKDYTTVTTTTTTFDTAVGGNIDGIDFLMVKIREAASTGTPNVTAGLVTASSLLGNFTGFASGITGTPNITAGVITDLPVLSTTTSYSGGVAGSLAGTVVSNGTNTCTAGGAGTTCIGQFVTELSILD